MTANRNTCSSLRQSFTSFEEKEEILQEFSKNLMLYSARVLDSLSKKRCEEEGHIPMNLANQLSCKKCKKKLQKTDKVQKDKKSVEVYLDGRWVKQANLPFGIRF